MITLILAFIVGCFIGACFVLNHNTDILKGMFKDMTEEELIKWFRTKIKGAK
jgi:hypothetical protein